MCSHLFSLLLTSSELFSHLLSWAQLLSARLTSSQLFSAHSQIISPFLWPKTCSKNGSRHQSQQPLHFPQRRFDTEKLLHTASFCIEKLVHAELFFTELGKLLSTASFYTKQAFVHSKLLPRKPFTHRSFYTEKLLHTASFDTKKLLHRKAFTHRKLLHTESFCTKKPLDSFYTQKPLHSFYTQRAYTQRSFYT